jgi:hypothetical protein
MKPIPIWGAFAEPEQNDQQRVEREDRHRVIGGEQRVQGLAHGAVAVQRHGGGDADHQRQAERDRGIGQGLGDRGVERSGNQDLRQIA